MNDNEKQEVLQKKPAETATIEDMCKYWGIKKENMHICPREPWRIDKEVGTEEKIKK